MGEKSLSVSGRLTCQVELSWCRNLEIHHQVGLFLRFHCSAAHAYKHTQSLVAAGSVSHFITWTVLGQRRDKRHRTISMGMCPALFRRGGLGRTRVT